MINVRKCRGLLVNRKQNVITFDYSIGGETLQQCDQMRYLGAIFYKKLPFLTHVFEITSSAYKKTWVCYYKLKTFFRNKHTGVTSQCLC